MGVITDQNDPAYDDGVSPSIVTIPPTFSSSEKEGGFTRFLQRDVTHDGLAIRSFLNGAGLNGRSTSQRLSPALERKLSDEVLIPDFNRQISDAAGCVKEEITNSQQRAAAVSREISADVETLRATPERINNLHFAPDKLPLTKYVKIQIGLILSVSAALILVSAAVIAKVLENNAIIAGKTTSWLVGLSSVVIVTFMQKHFYGEIERESARKTYLKLLLVTAMASGLASICLIVIVNGGLSGESRPPSFDSPLGGAADNTSLDVLQTILQLIAEALGGSGLYILAENYLRRYGVAAEFIPTIPNPVWEALTAKIRRLSADRDALLAVTERYQGELDLIPEARNRFQAKGVALARDLLSQRIAAYGLNPDAVTGIHDKRSGP